MTIISKTIHDTALSEIKIPLDSLITYRIKDLGLYTGTKAHSKSQFVIVLEANVCIRIGEGGC